jgi:hypothetical protein
MLHDFSKPLQIAFRRRTAQIETAVPPTAAAGERYDERGMRMLDSERR